MDSSFNYEIVDPRIGKPRVSYSCPKCQEYLESPLSDAGNNDRCPHCRASFTVPGAKELHRRAEEAQTKRQQREQRKQEKEAKIREQLREEDRQREEKASREREQYEQLKHHQYGEPRPYRSSKVFKQAAYHEEIPEYNGLVFVGCTLNIFAAINLVASFFALSSAFSGNDTSENPTVAFAIFGSCLLSFCILLGLGQMFFVVRDIAVNSWATRILLSKTSE